jgi:hypothetical protein
MLQRDKRFDNDLDARYQIVIEGVKIEASDALATDPIRYLEALQSFRDQQLANAIQDAISLFPQPIAYRIYKFDMETDVVARFHRLKDAWEALITFLYVVSLVTVHGEKRRENRSSG